MLVQAAFETYVNLGYIENEFNKIIITNSLIAMNMVFYNLRICNQKNVNITTKLFYLFLFANII